MTLPSVAAKPQSVSADDERFMRAAIALGRRWQGSTSPNPSVGSIVVRDGEIVGRGATKPGASA